MTDNPIRAARGYLNATPLARAGAFLSAAAAAVCLFLLVVVFYLLLDLLVHQGARPAFHSLAPRQQELFEGEWARSHGNDPAVQEAYSKLGGPTTPLAPASYLNGFRYDAVQQVGLERVAGPDAARTMYPDADPAAASAAVKRFGLLSFVARERDSWTGRLAGWFARWNPWAWQPGESGSANPRYLSGLFLVGLTLAVLRGLLLNLAAYLSAVTALAAASRLRRAVFTHSNRLGALAVKRESQAEAADLVTDRVDAVQAGVNGWVLNGVHAPLLVLLMVVVLLGAGFWLGLAFLLMAALVWVVGGQAAAWFRRDARRAARRAEVRQAGMRESMALAQLVKSYLMERFNQNRVERQLADLAKADWRQLRGQAVARPLLVSLAIVAGVVLLYLGGRSVLAGESTVAGLGAKLVALLALGYAVRQWVDTRVKVRQSRAAFADVFEFLDRRGDSGQPIDAEFLQPMQSRLDVTEVSVREPGTGRMVLDNVSLSIAAGTRAAVVAADPAETQAFAHLLTRLVEPTAGEVRMDGKNLRWVTFESLRTQIAYVGQRSLVFTDTVANNIGCGDAGFSLPQIMEAAKVVHAHQFIQKLPYGYETLIGDPGHSLRPGERFRIALARAVLRDPSLIVIEEPRDPLDEDTKALLDDAFDQIQTGRTLLFVPTRETTVRSADRVFLFHKGQLAAAGTHDELMASSGLYRQLLFKEIATPVGAA